MNEVDPHGSEANRLIAENGLILNVLVIQSSRCREFNLVLSART